MEMGCTYLQNAKNIYSASIPNIETTRTAKDGKKKKLIEEIKVESGELNCYINTQHIKATCRKLVGFAPFEDNALIYEPFQV